MKTIETKSAVGTTLAHDITRIIRGEVKDTPFRKGHIVTEEDIPLLLSLGKDHLFVYENDPSKVHEDEAALILKEICLNENMSAGGVKEGKIEIYAKIDGLFLSNVSLLKQINSVGELMIATIPSGIRVKKGDMLAGFRIIPLLIDKAKLESVKTLAGSEPLLKIMPYKAKKYGVVTTGNEVFHGRIKDTFTPVVEEKLAEYGAVMVAHEVVDDQVEHIEGAINKLKAMDLDMIFCTGGMSVDPDDMTPLAIKRSAKKIVSYGAPTLPGAMFLIAYLEDGRPICGLPGCVMYNERTIFDIALMHLMADHEITAEAISALGNGGLCRGCKPCHFPNCGFGRGQV